MSAWVVVYRCMQCHGHFVCSTYTSGTPPVLALETSPLVPIPSQIGILQRDSRLVAPTREQRGSNESRCVSPWCFLLFLPSD